MSNETYLVATIRRWNIKMFHEILSQLPGQWRLVTKPEELTLPLVEQLRPRYIFFPHWSQRVPREILDAAQCVCFHETDLPSGRGGSPIQNLIARGHKETTVTAIQMVEELDAGSIYLKRRLSLEGLGEEIFLRTANLVAEMIETIVAENPTPQPQTGPPSSFARRRPEQSDISLSLQDLDHLFDHIRMLDADGYPRAFIDVGDFRIEFSRPALRTNSIVADVQITRRAS